jgi:hypothetical protein
MIVLGETHLCRILKSYAHEVLECGALEIAGHYLTFDKRTQWS